MNNWEGNTLLYQSAGLTVNIGPFYPYRHLVINLWTALWKSPITSAMLHLLVYVTGSFVTGCSPIVCFMHACLLGGRCLDRRCRVLLKHPGTLCGGCVYQRAIAARGGERKKCITFMHLFPMFQLLYCLAHLHSFIYLLIWHFCYTEHVSFIYIKNYIEQLCWFFFKNNHFII